MQSLTTRSARGRARTRFVVPVDLTISESRWANTVLRTYSYVCSYGQAGQSSVSGGRPPTAPMGRFRAHRAAGDVTLDACRAFVSAGSAGRTTIGRGVARSRRGRAGFVKTCCSREAASQDASRRGVPSSSCRRFTVAWGMLARPGSAGAVAGTRYQPTRLDPLRSAHIGGGDAPRALPTGRAWPALTVALMASAAVLETRLRSTPARWRWHASCASLREPCSPCKHGR